MIELPIPTFDDLLPLLPGAAIGATCAVVASRVGQTAVAAALTFCAVLAPWWMTWSVTHGGIDFVPRTVAERAALALAFWSAIQLALPPRGPAAGAVRVAVGAACVGFVLWTFLDPGHPHHVGWADVALVGVFAPVLAWPGSRLEQCHPFTVLTVTSIGLSVLGMALLGGSGAAALSQVVASTSIAAALLAGAALGFARRAGISPAVVTGWLGVGYLATVSAHVTSDRQLSVMTLSLLGMIVLAPSVASHLVGRTSEHGLRARTRAALAIGIAIVCAIGVLFTIEGPVSPAASESDPSGGLEEFR